MRSSLGPGVGIGRVWIVVCGVGKGWKVSDFIVGVIGEGGGDIAVLRFAEGGGWIEEEDDMMAR